MAHCPYEKMKDIEGIFKELRKIKELKEPKPGIFYYKQKGFLHFHIDKEEHRWADVRDGENWGRPLKLAIGANALAQKKFLAEVLKRYKRISAR